MLKSLISLHHFMITFHVTRFIIYYVYRLFNHVCEYRKFGLNHALFYTLPLLSGYGQPHISQLLGNNVLPRLLDSVKFRAVT